MQRSKYIRAVAPRQIQVEYDQVRRVGVDRFESFIAIADDVNGVTLKLQAFAQKEL